MAKKDFKGGLNSLMGGPSKPVPSAKPAKEAAKKRKVGRPATINRTVTKTSQEGLKEGWTRATFIVREDLLEKVKNLAYWDRKQVKEVVNEAIESHVKGKRIKPRQ